MDVFYRTWDTIYLSYGNEWFNIASGHKIYIQRGSFERAGRKY